MEKTIDQLAKTLKDLVKNVNVKDADVIDAVKNTMKDLKIDVDAKLQDNSGALADILKLVKDQKDAVEKQKKTFDALAPEEDEKQEQKATVEEQKKTFDALAPEEDERQEELYKSLYKALQDIARDHPDVFAGSRGTGGGLLSAIGGLSSMFRGLAPILARLGPMLAVLGAGAAGYGVGKFINSLGPEIEKGKGGNLGGYLGDKLYNATHSDQSSVPKNSNEKQKLIDHMAAERKRLELKPGESLSAALEKEKAQKSQNSGGTGNDYLDKYPDDYNGILNQVMQSAPKDDPNANAYAEKKAKQIFYLKSQQSAKTATAASVADSAYSAPKTSNPIAQTTTPPSNLKTTSPTNITQGGDVQVTQQNISTKVDRKDPKWKELYDKQSKGAGLDFAKQMADTEYRRLYPTSSLKPPTAPNTGERIVGMNREVAQNQQQMVTMSQVQPQVQAASPIVVNNNSAIAMPSGDKTINSTNNENTFNRLLAADVDHPHSAFNIG